MANGNKEKEFGEFLDSLEKYDALRERERREEAAMKTFFIGMPAKAEISNQLLIVQFIGTEDENIVQVKTDDIEQIIELEKIRNPVTQESIRQVKVIIKPGASFVVSFHRKAIDIRQPRIRIMRRAIRGRGIQRLGEPEGCGGPCSCGCGCWCNPDDGDTMSNSRNDDFCTTMSHYDSDWIDHHR